MTSTLIGSSEVEPWLYGVARKVLANALRSERRTQRVAARLGHHDRAADGPDLAAEVAERARLAGALALLAEKDREALRLVGWEELDLAGAARAAGCSRGVQEVLQHATVAFAAGSQTEPTCSAGSSGQGSSPRCDGRTRTWPS